MGDLTVIICLAFDHRAETTGAHQFKQCILDCKYVEAALEVSGTFDLIIQARLSSIAEYTEQMDRIADSISRYVSRIEANFVGRRVERKSEEKEFLWLPCHGGRRRVDAHLIDKIVAEGDYMRVHVGDWNCLVHETMARLSEKLGKSFIQLHRSSLVRIGFIDRLLHGDHRWTARLQDGTQLRVAKSHVGEVLRLMNGESSNDEGGSAGPEPRIGNPKPMNEMRIRNRA